jgi:hypothetical protein
MPSVQIKDVPADVHAELRRRAARAGQSLQEYLLGRLIEQARTPSLEDLFDRVEREQGGNMSLADAVAAVRAERDSH